MKTVLQINTGFITNSSSQVCFFDRKLLDDPEIKAFLEAFSVSGGYIGPNLWHRGNCGSVLITQEQKEKARKELEELEEGFFSSYAPSVDGGEDTITIIYGDEYSDDLAYILSRKLTALLNDGRQIGDEDYVYNDGESFN